MSDTASGDHIGVWYLDPYARPGKRSGAWATSYRSHETFDGPVTVLGSNNANFIKGLAGEPVLVSWDDAETFFHEFGHCLHSILTTADYAEFAGTAVARDFVEAPSQMLENWKAEAGDAGASLLSAYQQ